jgi:hypothetical protein
MSVYMPHQSRISFSAFYGSWSFLSLGSNDGRTLIAPCWPCDNRACTALFWLDCFGSFAVTMLGAVRVATYDMQLVIPAVAPHSFRNIFA